MFIVAYLSALLPAPFQAIPPDGYWSALRRYDLIAIRKAGPTAARWIGPSGMNVFWNFVLRDDEVGEADFGRLVETLKLLKSLGADINYRRPPGSDTPLHNAAYHGGYWATKALIQCGANPNLYRLKPQRDTALTFALYWQRAAPAKAMIEGGVDLSLPGGRNRGSPLAQASWNGMVELVELMLKRGAKTEQVNMEMETALHAAAMRNTKENAAVVRLLLKHGANRGAISKRGETPLELARRKKNDLIVKAFAGT